MVERCAPQREVLVGMDDLTTRSRPALDRDVLLPGRRRPQPVKVRLAAGRVVHRYRQPAMVERQPQDHAGQAEAMVAVEVGDADPCDLGR